MPTTTAYVRVSPASIAVRLSVLLMVKLTAGVKLSVSIAWLSDVSGSDIPAGRTTEAELISRPEADGRMVALMVKFMVPAGARLMRVSILPKPFAV